MSILSLATVPEPHCPVVPCPDRPDRAAPPCWRRRHRRPCGLRLPDRRPLRASATDDAHVHADYTTVVPRVSGQIHRRAGARQRSGGGGSGAGPQQTTATSGWRSIRLEGRRSRPPGCQFMPPGRSRSSSSDLRGRNCEDGAGDRRRQGQRSSSPLPVKRTVRTEPRAKAVRLRQRATGAAGGIGQLCGESVLPTCARAAPVCLPPNAGSTVPCVGALPSAQQKNAGLAGPPGRGSVHSGGHVAISAPVAGIVGARSVARSAGVMSRSARRGAGPVACRLRGRQFRETQLVAPWPASIEIDTFPTSC